jgi:hypothetical protein
MRTPTTPHPGVVQNKHINRHASKKQHEVSKTTSSPSKQKTT